jgi:hypothetical protein
MKPEYLADMIEGAPNEERVAFEADLDKLTDEQLRRLLPFIGVSFRDDNSVGRDDMIAVMGETTWGEYFTAYRSVVGKPSALERSRPNPI